MSGVDLVVASRLRALRQSRLLTLEQVAEYLRAETQQVSRYEASDERVSATHLVDLARLFDVPISSFFEGLERVDLAEPALEGSFSSHDEIMKYLFGNLSDPQRSALLGLVKALSEQTEPKERSHGT